jgi:hypothetical protein
MLRRLSTLAPLLLAGGLLLAGCGSGGSSTSTVTEAATTPGAATTTSTTGTVTAPTVTAGESSSAKSPAKVTTTPVPTASTGTWNTAQCNTALFAWYKAHSGASVKQARSYRLVLGHDHQCFTAKSHAPVPVSTANTWNSVQCNTALIAWYKSHPRPGKAQLHSYKASLSRAHGCFTAASLAPRSSVGLKKGTSGGVKKR